MYFNPSRLAARRMGFPRLVMFSSYLYLAEGDLLRACDRMKNQSDYETHLPK
jgi:hypothetical protein